MRMVICLILSFLRAVIPLKMERFCFLMITLMVLRLIVIFYVDAVVDSVLILMLVLILTLLFVVVMLMFLKSIFFGFTL